MLSFAVAGVICACAALCYAEMATMMPAAGSAYTYTYAVLGELLAWIVGWSLILEYTVARQRGRGRLVGACGRSSSTTASIPMPCWPACQSGGLVNLPAVLISLVVTGLLIVGTRESATVNLFLVAIKLAALVLFVVLASRSFDAAHFHPFLPYGLSAHTDPDGTKRGVMAAAALIFFAFYGFDAVSTAAEETINPKRDLTIGIIGSMGVCTLIYMAVAASALGAAVVSATSPRAARRSSMCCSSPITRLPRYVVASAAVIALPAVILVLLYGQSRIFFVMARDGLLPRKLAAVSKTRGTPVLMTLLTGLVAAALAGTLDLSQIALLANAGTLCAFVAVSLCVLVLRVRDPGRPRIFRVPLAWIVAPFCILGCLYLFGAGLRTQTRSISSSPT